MMRWLRWTVFTLVLAAVIHYITIASAPSIIMSRVLTVIEKTSKNSINFSERPSAASRAIVRPSPDLLYSTCLYDVSRAPMKIVTGAPTDTYWSVAFYADNTDNFFVLNDKQANQKPATIILIGQGQTLPPQEAGVIVVSAPTSKGLVLFRTLINSDARLAEIDQQRRGATCDTVR